MGILVFDDESPKTSARVPIIAHLQLPRQLPTFLSLFIWVPWIAGGLWGYHSFKNTRMELDILLNGGVYCLNGDRCFDGQYRHFSGYQLV